ncbi:STAS domain-containing protein [Agaribacter marinus]|uniref:MlaB-like STAS domain-containing protein n=1 Tax=Agaribacter marinus TaxID=1431249 RepID=A0AA37WJ73_9ALTE|nr:STAS domain-containing protein [Agaribacter marinus]GLR72856.1 hypothetical protein GCM10007852_37640 [Agaribacter marinus]
MSISVETEGTTFRVNINGRFNRSVIKQDLMLTEHANAMTLPSISLIEVDFTGSEEHDTASLGWLVNLVRDIKAHKKQIKLTNVPSALHALAKLSNVDELIFDENLNDK